MFNPAFFDKDFTQNEFRKFMAVMGGAVLFVTLINTTLSIIRNSIELKQLAELKKIEKEKLQTI